MYNYGSLIIILFQCSLMQQVYKCQPLMSFDTISITFMTLTLYHIEWIFNPKSYWSSQNTIQEKEQLQLLQRRPNSSTHQISKAVSIGLESIEFWTDFCVLQKRTKTTKKSLLNQRSTSVCDKEIRFNLLLVCHHLATKVVLCCQVHRNQITEMFNKAMSFHFDYFLIRL